MRSRHHITFVLMLIAFAGVSTGVYAKKPQTSKAPDDGKIGGYAPEFIDTVRIRPFELNNYLMVGVEYGPSLNAMFFNPSYRQERFLSMDYCGFSITKYGKMFGYMPYFGLQTGLFYGHEGYKYKEDTEKHYTHSVEGATQCIYDIVEVPLLLEGHYDSQHFKLLADIGPYAGYRLNINRIGDAVTDEMRNTFLDTDHRLDYGLEFAAGVGYVFSPFEIHIKAKMRLSWSNLYDPDYASQYYYKFATPFDFMLTAGIHYQLTKRNGKTKPVIKREAYESVFGDK